MNNNTEVVIIGAGAVGCATAYFLCKSGVSTTLIERTAVASQASGFAAGTIVPLSGKGIPGPLEELAQVSFAMHIGLWNQLENESGIDFQARRESSLRVAFNQGDIDGLLTLYNYWKRLGTFSKHFSVDWVEPAEVRTIESRLSPEITKALYVEGTGALDSHQYTSALLKAAESYGCAFRTGSVKGIKRAANNRVTGVFLEDGELACNNAVLAMGPWTYEAETWTKVPIPITPLKGQILRLNIPDPPLKLGISHNSNYLACKPDGLTWAGTTEEQVGFDTSPTLEAKSEIMEAARKIMPCIDQSTLALHTACLRPDTPDGLPIIDRIPGWDGLFTATGAARKGILLSLAMGQATADLVTKGQSQIPISEFKLDRF